MDCQLKHFQYGGPYQASGQPILGVHSMHVSLYTNYGIQAEVPEQDLSRCMCTYVNSDYQMCMLVDASYDHHYYDDTDGRLACL